MIVDMMHTSQPLRAVYIASAVMSKLRYLA